MHMYTSMCVYEYMCIYIVCVYIYIWMLNPLSILYTYY